MIDYKAIFTNTDGVNFPNTKAVNASGPATTDGTEFIKALVDDLWGRTQAILDHAGLTPDGITESPANSQHIEALQKGFIHPGSGVIWWQDSDPSVLGARVLLLNGQGVLRASYTDLDTAVYVGDGNNATASAFFRADDAAGTSRNIAGAYLILPDMRGYTLRGLDVAASVDPDGASRDIGSVQADAFQGHWHAPADGATRFKVIGGSGTLLASGGTSSARTSATTNGPVTDGVNGTPRTSLESRMINVATRFGITY